MSHKTLCFLTFGHVVDVGAGKRGGLPIILLVWDLARVVELCLWL